MRILLLTGEHPEVEGTNGGIGSFVALAADALADAGHDVHQLVCATGLSALDRPASAAHPAALHTRPVLAALRPVRGRGPRLAAIAASCRWHARRLGAFDVVEAPDFHGLGAFMPSKGLVIQLQTPAAVVAREDGREVAPPRGTTWLEQRAVRRAAAVLSISDLLVAELRSMDWLPADQPVALAPPIVDLSLPPVEAPTGPPTVLGIGRLEPRKGFELLIDAVAAMAPPDVRLEIAGADTTDGRGWWSGELQRHADGRGIDLVLLGQVEREELRAALQRASVVAVPSTFDSFNLAGLEALAAGRPVVVSPRVGLAERADGSPAIVVVDRTPTAFAAALTTAIQTDPDAVALAARRVADAYGPSAFAADRGARYTSLR